MISVPRSEIFLVRAQLTRLDAAAISEAARLEFPLPLEELLWAHHVVSSNEVLLAGIRRARYEWYRQEAKRTRQKLIVPDATWLLPIKSQRENILAGTALAVTLIGLLFSRLNRQTAAQIKTLRPMHSVPSVSADPATPTFINIIKHLPAGMCLLDYTYDAARHSVSVRGRAADYGKVSDFADAFKAVHADKSSLLQIGGRQIVEFSLDIPLL